LRAADGGWYEEIVAANIYQAVKQAMQDLVAPQLESLKGEVGAVRLDIRRVEEKLTTEIQRVEEKLSSEIQRVDEKLTTEIHRVDDKLSTEMHRIDEKLTWALDLRERIIVLETKLALPGSGA
jgi:hypothetical protein